MKYAFNKNFTFSAIGGILPTIRTGDMVILIETEDLMTGKKTYNLEPDNGKGICDNREFQTFTYHGHIRTVDDVAVRARGLHKVLEIGENKDWLSPDTHCMVTVGEDLKQEWE